MWNGGLSPPDRTHLLHVYFPTSEEIGESVGRRGGEPLGLCCIQGSFRRRAVGNPHAMPR